MTFFYFWLESKPIFKYSLLFLLFINKSQSKITNTLHGFKTQAYKQTD